MMSLENVKEGPRALCRKAWLGAIVLTTSVLFASVSAGNASAEKLILDCTPVNDSVPRSVKCDFRSTTPYSPSTLTISANGEVLTNSKFDPFRTSGQTTAWLYLIDRSNPARANTVRRNVELATRMVDQASSTMKIGVATFASGLQTILPIASSHTDAAARLAAVKADGVATEFFANSLEGIKMLSEVNADRKALVLISDGKAEDTAYSLSDVVKAAREAGVTIMGLGFAERATETPSLQSIRRLSDETDGYFRAVVGNEPLPSGFVDDLKRYIDNGGTISAPLPNLDGDVAITVKATLQDNSVLAANSTVKIEPVPTMEEETKPVSRISAIYAVLSPGAGQWAQDNGSLAWTLLLLPFVLLAGAIGYFASRRSAEPLGGGEDELVTGVVRPVDIDNVPEDAGDTRLFKPGSGGEFGFFEIVGNESTKYPLDSQSVSIGRHSDNDLQLANDSVHRHHAHLTVTPSGEVVIRDLDTQNGVIVNGVRVKNSKLFEGDLVELGEVRMRFRNG